VNLELKSDQNSNFLVNENSSSSSKLNFEDVTPSDVRSVGQDFGARNERDRLSKLDQIVQNLYSTHKFGNPMTQPVTSPDILTGKIYLRIRIYRRE
jgi:hypothetical protein